MCRSITFLPFHDSPTLLGDHNPLSNNYLRLSQPSPCLIAIPATYPLSYSIYPCPDTALLGTWRFPWDHLVALSGSGRAVSLTGVCYCLWRVFDCRTISAIPSMHIPSHCGFGFFYMDYIFPFLAGARCAISSTFMSRRLVFPNDMLRLENYVRAKWT